MQVKASGLLVHGHKVPLSYDEDPQGRLEPREFKADSGVVYKMSDLRQLSQEQVLVAVFNYLRGGGE